MFNLTVTLSIMWGLELGRGGGDRFRSLSLGFFMTNSKTPQHNEMKFFQLLFYSFETHFAYIDSAYCFTHHYFGK